MNFNIGKSKIEQNFKIDVLKELENLQFKGTFKSKFKRNLEIWYLKRNFGKFGKLWGNFQFGVFWRGSQGDAPGGTNRSGSQRPAFKTLSKNPFKLRLVRE